MGKLTHIFSDEEVARNRKMLSPKLPVTNFFKVVLKLFQAFFYV